MAKVDVHEELAFKVAFMKTQAKIPADQRPRCPICGEPARMAFCVAKVQVLLEIDGSFGTIVRSGDVSPIGDTLYLCGGGHRWKGDAP
jgi:hypothetical protein